MSLIGKTRRQEVIKEKSETTNRGMTNDRNTPTYSNSNLKMKGYLKKFLRHKL